MCILSKSICTATWLNMCMSMSDGLIDDGISILLIPIPHFKIMLCANQFWTQSARAK
jgi:hypothetical protein